jgi:glycerol uptake facilitator-like aquaporin
MQRQAIKQRIMSNNLSRRLAAELGGTAFLLAAVAGSGVMAERLAGANAALALLGNTIPTGAILVVIILIFAPVSGAHFNPGVTLAFGLGKKTSPSHGSLYIIAQVAGAFVGVWVAHIMFELPVVQASLHIRAGPAQWFSEAVAAFGLVLTILGCVRYRPMSVAIAVGLYISAACWFTASTSFANPAVTKGRAFTDSFSGTRPADMPAFLVAQRLGATLAVPLGAHLFRRDDEI